jgi:hypothetical protein
MRSHGTEYVPTEVCGQVERALPRLESALIQARYEVSKRIDKRRRRGHGGGRCCLLRLILISIFHLVRCEEELEAHIEEVSSCECVSTAVTVGPGQREWRIRECAGKRGELRFPSTA